MLIALRNVLIGIAGLGLIAACAKASGDGAASSEDGIKREGDTQDTSDGLDPSQCEAILARATAAVKAEGRAANPQRMLLSTKDVSCLAYEVSMRQRLNDQNQVVPNPHDVLLSQLFFAAQLGSKAGFDGTGSSSGQVPPDPPGDTLKIDCGDRYPNIATLNMKRVEAVTERQACTAFGRGLHEYLETRAIYKSFLADDVEIHVGADGSPVRYDERQRLLELPWHFATTSVKELTTALVKARFATALAQRGSYDQPTYADNQRLVEIKNFALPADFVAHAKDAAKLRFTIERAGLEGNATNCYDYVLVQNAAGTELRKICGTQTGTFDVELSASYKFILSSDTSGGDTGVKLSWVPVLTL